jgi:hypothetical protein
MTKRLCELETNNEQLQKQINKLKIENLKYKKIIFCGQFKNWVFETLYNTGEITVVSLTGGRTQIPVAHYTTVLDIKKAIHEIIGIQEHQCRLIFGSKQIMNHRTLFHYLIPAGGTIHMVLNINPRPALELCLNETQLLEKNSDLWYQERHVTNLIRTRGYEQRYGFTNSIREPRATAPAAPAVRPDAAAARSSSIVQECATPNGPGADYEQEDLYS